MTLWAAWQKNGTVQPKAKDHKGSSDRQMHVGEGALSQEEHAAQWKTQLMDLGEGALSKEDCAAQGEQ